MILEFLFKVRQFFLVRILKKNYLLIFEDSVELREFNSPKYHIGKMIIIDEKFKDKHQRYFKNYKTTDLGSLIKFKDKWHLKNVSEVQLRKIISIIMRKFNK